MMTVPFSYLPSFFNLLHDTLAISKHPVVRGPPSHLLKCYRRMLSHPLNMTAKLHQEIKELYGVWDMNNYVALLVPGANCQPMRPIAHRGKPGKE